MRGVNDQIWRHNESLLCWPEQEDAYVQVQERKGCSVSQCFGGCFFNILAFRVCTDRTPDDVSVCNDTVLTKEHNARIDQEKRCCPILASMIVSERN